MSAFFAWPGPAGQESFRFGRSLIAAVVCGLLSVSGQAAEPKLPKLPADKNWKIEIIPGPAIGSPTNPKFEQAMKQALAAKAETSPAPANAVVPADAEAAMPAGITPASYIEVYNSIPFRRSEYAANPNYRHEATIELLLGQIRPKNVTNISAPSATCCSPQTAMFDKWFAPWGTNAFDYRFSRYRP